MIPVAHIITLLDTLDTPRWKDTVTHLNERGVEHKPFTGINGARWGLATLLTYNEDNPGTGYRIGSKTIGMSLSHYMLWKVFSYLPSPATGIGASPLDSWMVCEDDVRFVPDWKPKLEAALSSVPNDWDMLYVGSCNAQEKVRGDFGNGVHLVDGPQCSHCYMVRRKALPVLLETQQLAWAGIDLQLIFKSHPFLKVYTILPRIADQHETNLWP